jgi:hypothetical protein
MSAICFQLEPFRADDVRDDIDTVEAILADFWASLEGQARILARVRPFSFLPRQDAIERLLTPDIAPWRKRFLREQHKLYTDMERARAALTVDHYLLLWPGPVNLDLLEATLPEALCVPSVARVPVPQLIPGSYIEHATYLEPQTPGHPYLAVLTAYDVRGGWSLIDLHDAQSWERLLLMDVELTLAIDVRTLDPFTADRRTTNAVTVLSRSVRGRLTDQRSADALLAAQHVQEVLSTQSLHEVRYAVLVHAPSLTSLDRTCEQIRTRMGRRLRLERVPGTQAEHLAFFTHASPRSIQSPIPARNTTSHGLACKATWGVRRGGDLAGPCWGTDLYEQMPIHHEVFGADGKQSANGIILGTSGAGKTVGMQTLALRHAAEGFQVILMEPANTCWRLRDAIGNCVGRNEQSSPAQNGHDRAGRADASCPPQERGCAYYDVSEMPAVNILDPMTTQPVDQRDSIIRKLEVALGRGVEAGGRIRVEPRVLSRAERGTLDVALRHERIYGAECHKLASLTPLTAPRLEDLVAVLIELGLNGERPEATELAHEIDDVLLGTAARIFNLRTELRFDADADVILYSFRGVKPERLPIMYDYLFDTIHSYVWSPERDRPDRRPVLMFIDEFFYMAAVSSLEQYVVKASKTWRNRGAGLFTADQNAETYFGAGGDWGPFVTENVRHKLFFQLEGGAKVIERAYEGILSPAHIQQLKRLGRGQCLAMLDRQIRTLQIDLLPREAQHLI